MAIQFGKGKWYEWPFGGLFNSPTVEGVPEWQRKLGADLGGWANTYLKNFVPGEAYGGNLDFAGQATDQEESGLGLLTKYLSNAGTGNLFEQASNQVSDTLTGKFADPNQSPFIKAMNVLAKQNLSDAITTERGQRGARGTYYTQAGIDAESKLTERTQNNLNAIIGQFIQNERQNQVNAVDKAKTLDQYFNQTVPLAKVGASQQFGGLKRLIQQANLESRYQDFLRQRNEMKLPLSVGTDLYGGGKAPDPAQLEMPSFFEKILPDLMKLLAAGAGAAA